MQNNYPAPLVRLIRHLMQLPGIGPKSAVRIAFHIQKMPEIGVQDLAEAIADVKKKITLCKECCNISETELCPICSDFRRDRQIICVVESPQDVNALEATHEYRGLYHVLHGLISPLEDIGPEDLTVPSLLERIGQNPLREVIIATSPNVEGEATSLFLARLIKPLGVKVSRIAFGLPMGSDLENVDEITLGRALIGRQEIL